MIGHEAQKAEKLSVEDVARKQLDGVFLKEFESLLDFFKEEQIRLPWKSINGFKMIYKGKNIGGFTLGAGGWLDNNIEKRNYIVIHIGTADRNDYDEYLHGQAGEIATLFMDQINNKCIHCRPTCGCSRVSGRTMQVSGDRYENVCMNAPGFKFAASGDSMQTMTMCTPRALYPPEEAQPVPLETIKKVIRARKAYIEKILFKEK